jgi:hypothetical protein
MNMKTLKIASSLGLLLLTQAQARAQFTYSTNYNGTLNLAQYTGTNPVVTIPSSSGGLTVRRPAGLRVYGRRARNPGFCPLP